MVYGKECESQDSGPSAEILISFISSLIINLLTQRWAADNYCRDQNLESHLTLSGDLSAKSRT